MNKTFGILAHVDAGKTTFSEQVLFRAHALRRAGRVDHRDAFMDSHPLERQRGITIFSDQATFAFQGDTWNWVDTPGHTDFAGEMERAIQVMDYAVLVVSCVEGVQSHTETVWRLLEKYGVPVFVFLNKTDRVGADPDGVLCRLRERFGTGFFDLRRGYQAGRLTDEGLIEQAAEGDEALLDRLFDGGYDERAWLSSIREQIARRQLFPVYAGAALSGEGVAEFMGMLSLLTRTQYDPAGEFSARVYKVRHDAQNVRLTFVKVLSGALSVKDEIETPFARGKISAMYRVEGAKYLPISRAEAGELAAVAGLSGTKSGDLLGAKPERSHFVTEPMMTAAVLAGREVSKDRLMRAFRTLEDEEPSLGVSWDEQSQRVQLRVMGPIQLEVLRQLVKERFSLEVDFGPCRVRYLETVAAPVVGIGHYEPLRHYAEVHLRLSPGEQGSGITFESACHVDTLALSWQRLIQTHVFEREHPGVLIGAPLTDLKITLLTGRAHIKHTEGGDFREATYRAIRQGLMQAKMVLLEPVGRFRLRAPREYMGRLLGDLQALHAQAEPPVCTADEVLLEGSAPLATMSGYQTDFLAATRGKGSFFFEADHYEPAHNAAEVIEQAHYEPLADEPADSVFCQHGAGITVAWYKVPEWAHCPAVPADNC